MSSIFVFQYLERGHAKYGLATDHMAGFQLRLDVTADYVKGFVDGVQLTQACPVVSGFPEECERKNCFVEGRRTTMKELNIDPEKTNLEEILGICP